MAKFMNKKIGVLMGGLSKERDISLKTGKGIFEALQRKGYNVAAIDCGRNIVDQIRNEKIDVAFIALHGSYGEDGCVQGLLEWLQIPYTGSGVLASSLAMDKVVLNSLSRDLGLLIPQETIFDARFETVDAFLSRFKMPCPVVVKPSREGSTINVTIVSKKDDLKKALNLALKSDFKVLVEEFIQGKEVTVSVLNGKALPSIEIAPKSGFYDYQSKYTKGMTDYILPARVSETCQKELAKTSEKIFRAIDCSGVIRADFMVSHAEEKPYFLEVNTIPGMTETSLVPKAAAHVGISYDDLCEQLLDGAGLKVTM
ncbi:MAG: hypothetical protein A3J24_08485 [Deltaproteobacteria bacterium RIFCSPLOWO2_02_FULL_53_8]|nr:MAG: hypothetical protein A3J24_08485 [Deltaproteobacteria bacterium RIFCSPLOWO2_02_FULL_53_8]